ncbi:MAG: hypothetical protein EXS14_10090 [Planctomycetes bacterium]|nr:hypothetical protein [Planctomycetota bacterium]
MGDFDGDSVVDFAYTVVPGAPSCNFTQVRYGDGAGGLGAPVVVYQAAACVTGFNAQAMDTACADFDGDGCDDKYFENRALFGGGATGIGGVRPTISVGAPTLGNAGFYIGMTGALPGSAAAFAASLTQAAAPYPALAPVIGLSASSLIWPLGGVTWTTTNVLGGATIQVPMPNYPALAGTTFFAQWAVADPWGTSVAPIAGLALSRGRTIILQ